MAEKTESLTTLLKECDLSLNPPTVFKALIRQGVVAEVEYLSTTGSGETKLFKQIQPEYVEYGINKPTMHDFKTEPRFYPSLFLDLLFRHVHPQITSELQELEEECQEQEE